MSTSLLLEAGAAFTAVLSADLAVIGAHFSHGAIAPAMADLAELLAGSGKHFVRLGGNIHFFRPKIFAEIWVHGFGAVIR
jgi:hypothetical protein